MQATAHSDALQTELFAPRHKATIEAGVARMLEALDGRDEPLTAAEFKSLFGWNKRFTRLCAEHSAGRIIGLWNGYKRTERVTPEEFNRHKSRQQAQTRRTTMRLIEEERVWHARRPANG